MKLAHGLSLFATLSFVSAGAWLGCSNSSTPATSDGGTPTPDGGSGNQDTGTGNPDTGTGNPDTGTGNPDTGTGTPDSGGDGGTIAQTCTAYCAAVQATCTGANAQYESTLECMNACAFFPAGTASDTGGDTLGCRITHTGLAATLPVPHCWHAGPYGFGVCGASVDNFCNLALDWCSPDAGYTGTPPYASLTACTTAAAAYVTADAGADPSAFNASGPGSGNTFDCRLYHLANAMNAAQGAAGQTTHCPHAGQTSAPCQ
jgi:hypothetical protein